MCTVVGSLLIAPLAVLAQQTTKVWRIGYLRRTSRESADIEALRLGLRELGYVELFDAAVASAQRESVEGAARRLGVTIAPIVWHGPDTLPAALQSATQDGVRGLIVLSSPHIHEQGNRRLVADAALKWRLPSIGMLNFARDGLLITYGPVQRDMLRSAANLVAKILDGAPPAVLPIERPVRYELVINLKTARALSLTIPPSLRSRVDEVIQ
jgi:putative ABC transport system substrate-binding protein